MQVSIIINNYNYGAYLAEAIDSALQQSHPDVEVIVVDDGSTDNSREIISRYGDRVVPIFKQNGGQGTCFNVGFERCHGDVVIFLDADDYLFEDAAALFADKLRDPAVSKCNGYLQIVDEEGRDRHATMPTRLSPAGDYRDVSLNNGPGSYVPCFTSGNAFSRRFLEEIFPIPVENRRLGSDAYLVTVDALFGRIEVIDHTVGAYRAHGQNHFPTTRVFDATNLAGLLDSMAERARYLAGWAEHLGYRVDAERWMSGNWRLVLARHALSCMDRSERRPSVSELVSAPFRQKDRNLWKALKISAYLMLLWTMPKVIGLEFTRRLLKFTKVSKQDEERQAMDKQRQFDGELLHRK